MANRTKRSPRKRREHYVGDNIRFADLTPKIVLPAATLGGGFLLLSFLLAYATHDSYRQFQHSYLVAFMYVLSIGLGALFWVMLQHLVGAKWSVAIRRIGEVLAYSLPLLALLSLPIVLPALVGNAQLFPWVDQGYMSSTHSLEGKRPYLNVGFFTVRWLLYFGVWGGLSYLFFSQSTAHDRTGEQRRLDRLRSVSAPAMIAFALTTTFAAIDFLMTLDPAWFSTIFGVYYFAGCVVSTHGAISLALMYLQSHGRLTKSITTHHYHDLGKMMFAFTIFWAYIAFSQFMLIWYGNIPEETVWYLRRIHGSWLTVGVVLIVGHFFLPFVGLLSRHVKRSRAGLMFWSFWLLAIHYVDLYYLVMPQAHPQGVSVHALDLTCLVGLVGVFIAYVAWHAARTNLVPTRDPRLAQSLAFENM